MKEDRDKTKRNIGGSNCCKGSAYKKMNAAESKTTRFSNKKPDLSTGLDKAVAEREGFEPSVEVSPHTRLAGERLQPTRPSLLNLIPGGGSRIRTHGALTLNGFQDRRLQPLGHPSQRFEVVITKDRTGQYFYCSGADPRARTLFASSACRWIVC